LFKETLFIEDAAKATIFDAEKVAAATSADINGRHS
jgi:hypothetical protein